MERFQLEARSAARLHHTHIVPVHGVGEHDGVPYYAMQYIRGHGLDQVLQDVRRLRANQLKPMLRSDDSSNPLNDGSLAVAKSLLTGRFADTRPDLSKSDYPSPPLLPDITSVVPVAANSAPKSESMGKPSETGAGSISGLSHPSVSGYHRGVAHVGL